MSFRTCFGIFLITKRILNRVQDDKYVERRWIMKNHWIATIILVVAVGAAGFFVGMQYQKMQRGNFASRFGGANGTFQRLGGANGMRPVFGQIISADATSITVKMNDGSTKIVIVSSRTSINKAATGTKDDLKTGETVAVFGTTNSDGSVTAQNIQLNPQQMRLVRPTGTPTGQ